MCVVLCAMREECVCGAMCYEGGVCVVCVVLCAMREECVCVCVWCCVL